jgi:hypothetical protein
VGVLVSLAKQGKHKDTSVTSSLRLPRPKTPGFDNEKKMKESAGESYYHACMSAMQEEELYNDKKQTDDTG